jgi:hypothetical protein
MTQTISTALRHQMNVQSALEGAMNTRVGIRDYLNRLDRLDGRVDGFNLTYAEDGSVVAAEIKAHGMRFRMERGQAVTVSSRRQQHQLRRSRSVRAVCSVRVRRTRSSHRVVRVAAKAAKATADPDPEPSPGTPRSSAGGAPC